MYVLIYFFIELIYRSNVSQFFHGMKSSVQGFLDWAVILKIFFDELFF